MFLVSVCIGSNIPFGVYLQNISSVFYLRYLLSFCGLFSSLSPLLFTHSSPSFFKSSDKILITEVLIYDFFT